MSLRAYLPSAHFGVLIGALALGGAFIAFSLGIFTPDARRESAVESATPQNIGGGDWRLAFASSSAFEDARNLGLQAATFAQAASTSNLTESVGRSVLIRTTAARSQGLGDDSPTQESIVGNILSQISSSQQAAPRNPYTTEDFSMVPTSAAALHDFGNALAAAITAHNLASMDAVVLSFGLAVDNQSPATLARLSPVAEDYRALARDIAAIPVPKTLAPVVVSIANTYAAMANTCPDMAAVLTDPVRGLSGLQTYNELALQNAHLLATVASALKNTGILFRADEAGAAWSVFLSSVEKAKTSAATTLRGTTSTTQ